MVVRKIERGDRTGKPGDLRAFDEVEALLTGRHWRRIEISS